MPRPRINGLAAAAAAITIIGVSIVLLHASSPPGRDVAASVPRPEVATPPRLAPPPPDVGKSASERLPAEAKDDPDRRTTTLTATVEPAASVEVVSEVSGRIGRLAVDVGSPVRAGDLLAEVESPGASFRMARAGVALERARARGATGRARVKLQDSAVKTARAELEAAQAELKHSDAAATYRRSQYERIAELVKKGALQYRVGEEEKQRMSSDEAGQTAARSRLAITRAELAGAEARLEVAVSEASEADHDVHLAELELAEARREREACRIHATIDGIVTRRHHDVGEFVRGAGAGTDDPIVTIVASRTVRVVAGVPDRDAARVDPGAPALFRPGAPPARDYRGTVSRIAPAEDPDTRTIRVEVDLDNGDGQLRPGQPGTLRLELAPGA